MPDNVIDTSKKISHFLYAHTLALLTFTKKKTWRDKIKNNPDLIQIPFPKICKHCSANTSLNYTILSSKQQGAMNKTLIREVPLWMAFKWLGFCLRLSNISSSESTVHFPPRITSILNTLMTPETYWWK